MTAMDELRAMLSERGTEYDETFEDGADYIWWSDGERGLFARLHHGALAVYGLSAQQAIAATLGVSDATVARQDGARTCQLTDNGPWGYTYECSECGAAFDVDAFDGEVNFCPNCGRRIEGVDE